MAENTELLRGIALGIEAAAKRADGRHRYEVARDIRSLNPADIAAKNPTDGQIAPNESARSDGIGHATTAAESAHRLGAEEARRKVLAKHPKAYARFTKITWAVWDPELADSSLLGSGPTEDAAWIDAAGRV